jgi:hypothetical protein
MLHTLFFDKFIFVHETKNLKIGIKFNEIWKECGKVRVSVCACVCVCVCKREKEKEVEIERERASIEKPKGINQTTDEVTFFNSLFL